MSHNYDVGTRAWQPDATEGWVASEVVKKTVDGDKVTLEFKLENEEVRFCCFPVLLLRCQDGRIPSGTAI